MLPDMKTNVVSLAMLIVVVIATWLNIDREIQMHRMAARQNELNATVAKLVTDLTTLEAMVAKLRPDDRPRVIPVAQ